MIMQSTVIREILVDLTQTHTHTNTQLPTICCNLSIRTEYLLQSSHMKTVLVITMNKKQKNVNLDIFPYRICEDKWGRHFILNLFLKSMYLTPTLKHYYPMHLFLKPFYMDKKERLDMKTCSFPHFNYCKLAMRCGNSQLVKNQHTAYIKHICIVWRKIVMFSKLSLQYFICH